MKRLLLGTGLLAALAAAVYLLKAFDPVQAVWFPRCVLNYWTGLHCPGCGTTRSLHALLNGDFVAAVRFNPMLIIGLPTICLLLWVGRRRESAGAINRGTLSLSIAAVVIAFFILRNLPSPSRSWLAPPTATTTVHR